MAPKTHLEKTYLVKVNGLLTDEQMEEFRSGVAIHGRRTAPAKIKLIKEAEIPGTRCGSSRAGKTRSA